jgi:hypothetical protein
MEHADGQRHLHYAFISFTLYVTVGYGSMMRPADFHMTNAICGLKALDMLVKEES